MIKSQRGCDRVLSYMNWLWVFSAYLKRVKNGGESSVGARQYFLALSTITNRSYLSAASLISLLNVYLPH